MPRSRPTCRGRRRALGGRADLQGSPTTPSARGRADRLPVFTAAGTATSAALSLALGVSAHAADRILAFGLGLAGLPELSRALAEGRVKVDQARLIQRRADGLRHPLAGR